MTGSGKTGLVTVLLEEALGAGVGVVVATQNPMDLDYRALSNAGLWCIGRLQTDADRERVVDGLAASLDAGAAEGDGEQELARTVQRLAPRWFVVRNAHASAPPLLLRPRDTLTPLIGPMTRTELLRARTQRTAPMPGTAAASHPGHPGRNSSSTGRPGSYNAEYLTWPSGQDGWMP